MKTSSEPAEKRRRKKLLRGRGISTYIWLYFMLFTVLILAVIWVFQYAFLGNYYRSAKIRDISKSANKIIRAFDTPAQNRVNKTIAFENSYCIVITDESGNVLVRENNLGSYSKLSADIDENFSLYIYELKNELSSSGRTTISRVYRDEEPGIEKIFYCAKVYAEDNENQAYLFIESAVEPFDSTVAIIRDQLIYVSLILLEIAVVVSVIISRRVSRPITDITETAKQFGAGDYDAQFGGEGYREVEELSEVLNDARDEIRKVSDLRRDLIANISHDLRTPLTMIKAYAEMIRDLSGDKPEKRNEHLKIIIDETDRLSNLVNNLLELSKLESGNIELNKKTFSITEKLRDCMTRYQLLVEENGYDIALEEDEDRTVEADPEKLDQVIYNFINNAVNYTGENKVIRVRQINLKDSVRIEVTDNGKGISEELLPKVFDRYYRGERVKRDIVGSGLGLSICKEILKRHGFAFGVRSKEGAGSTFWFEIPCVEARG